MCCVRRAPTRPSSASASMRKPLLFTSANSAATIEGVGGEQEDGERQVEDRVAHCRFAVRLTSPTAAGGGVTIAMYRDRCCGEASEHLPASRSASFAQLALQECDDLARRYVAGDEGLADAARQDEGEPAARRPSCPGRCAASASRRPAARRGCRRYGSAGRPRRGGAATRSASLGRRGRARAEKRWASTMPIATASPWTRRSE